MQKVLYAKFSNERAKKFQIVTLIVEKQGVKSVIKKAMNQDAQAHISRIAEHYEYMQDAYKDCPTVVVCPYKSLKTDQIEFPFIDGISCEQLIFDYVQSGNYDMLISKCEEIKELVSMFPNNLDLIPSNIIIDSQGKFNIIDYEWCAEKEEDISYLMFRMLFHCAALNLVKEETKEMIYQKMGVQNECISYYMNKELDFQQSVLGREGYTLGELSKQVSFRKIPVNEIDLCDFHIISQVHGMVNGSKKLFLTFEDSNMDIEHEIIDKDFSKCLQWIIMPTDTNAIIQIQKMEGIQNGQRVPILDFCHNAGFVQDKDYFFETQPCITVENEGYEGIHFKYKIYKKNDVIIHQLRSDRESTIELLKKNADFEKSTKVQIEELQKEIIAKRSLLEKILRKALKKIARDK